MSEDSLENALQCLEITCKTTEFRIKKLTQMVEAIEYTLSNNEDGRVKELLGAVEEVNEEVQALKESEDKLAKLLEENKNTIAKLYTTVDDGYKCLIYSIQGQDL